MSGADQSDSSDDEDEDTRRVAFRDEVEGSDEDVEFDARSTDDYDEHEVHGGSDGGE